MLLYEVLEFEFIILYTTIAFFFNTAHIDLYKRIWQASLLTVVTI